MIDTIKQSIAAGGRIELPAGRSIYIKKAAFPVDVTFYGPAMQFLGRALGIEQGFSFYAGAENGAMFFSVESASAQDLEIMTSSGELRLDKIDVASVTASVERAKTVETLIDISIPAASQGVVYAGDAAAIHVLISNLSDEYLRIGDINTGATRGARVEPQQSILLDSAGALYCYNAGPGTASLAVTVFKS